MKREPTLALLTEGEIEMLGVLPFASNYTYLVRLREGAGEALAVYKPTRGERPLWDFESESLGRREVAAFHVSEAGGWGVVPPTVFRTDGPLGAGSLQLFIDHDPQRHYLSMRSERRSEFASIAALDIVLNNADRKSGHVLEDRQGKLWGVDHGLTFHVEPKLRTVIWEFADEPLDDDVSVAVNTVIEALARGTLADELGGLLSAAETEALGQRARGLLAAGVYPAPSGPHPLPWPLV